MLVTLGVLAALVVALLAVPVRIDVDLDTARRGPMRVHVHWLVLSWQVGDPERRKRRARAPGARRRSPSRRWAGRFSVVRAVRTPGFHSRCWRLARELLQVVMPRRLWLRVRAGLDDPSATGELLGVVSALTGWVHPGRCTVRFEPDFEGESLLVRGRGSWRLRPASLLWPVVTFAVAPVVWRAAWSARAPHR